ncbi:hypothetical protein F4808DRAFT_295974 [Astrocystis sublimbata]|nr:hypothetical protein F4808DRAFT_295974 [Astrocystis sublimbata]
MEARQVPSYRESLASVTSCQTYIQQSQLNPQLTRLGGWGVRIVQKIVCFDPRTRVHPGVINPLARSVGQLRALARGRSLHTFPRRRARELRRMPVANADAATWLVVFSSIVRLVGWGFLVGGLALDGHKYRIPAQPTTLDYGTSYTLVIVDFFHKNIKRKYLKSRILRFSHLSSSYLYITTTKNSPLGNTPHLRPHS